jgi:hypothetical protein
MLAREPKGVRYERSNTMNLEAIHPSGKTFTNASLHFAPGASNAPMA